VIKFKKIEKNENRSKFLRKQLSILRLTKIPK